MKPRIAAIVLLSLLVTLVSNAQQFDGGMHAGIVGSEVDGDILGGMNKLGIFAGVYTGLQISKKVGFQLELDYFQKGSQDNADFESGDYSTYKMKADYLEVPVLFQFRPLEWLQLEAGPSMALLVNAKEYIDGNEQSLFAEFKPVTFNAIVGANFEFIRNLSVNVRFDTSLDPIREEDFTGNVKRFPFFKYGQYHNCLVLSLRYRFLRIGTIR